MSRHKINDVHDHVAFVFFARSRTDELSLSEKEITDGCRWFSKEDLQKNKELTESVRTYALKALEKLS